METRITKRQVLKAIQTEPLTSGNWMELEDIPVGTKINTQVALKNQDCKVCAVGSIFAYKMRGENITHSKANALSDQLSKMVRFATFNDGIFSDDSVINDYLYEVLGTTSTVHLNARKAVSVAKNMARGGLYLSALSCLFEFLTDQSYDYVNQDGTASYRTRRILTRFVEKNFPNTLVLKRNKKF